MPDSTISDDSFETPVTPVTSITLTFTDKDNVTSKTSTNEDFPGKVSNQIKESSASNKRQPRSRKSRSAGSRRSKSRSPSPKKKSSPSRSGSGKRSSPPRKPVSKTKSDSTKEMFDMEEKKATSTLPPSSPQSRLDWIEEQVMAMNNEKSSVNETDSITYQKEEFQSENKPRDSKVFTRRQTIRPDSQLLVKYKEPLPCTYTNFEPTNKYFSTYASDESPSEIKSTGRSTDELTLKMVYPESVTNTERSEVFIEKPDEKRKSSVKFLDEASIRAIENLQDDPRWLAEKASKEQSAKLIRLNSGNLDKDNRPSKFTYNIVTTRRLLSRVSDMISPELKHKLATGDTGLKVGFAN